MIELLAGGGVAIASGFVGAIMGYTRGRAERNLTSLFPSANSDSMFCTCGHAAAFHHNGTGSCKFEDRLTRDMVEGLTPIDSSQVRDQLRCRCQKFQPDPVAIEQARQAPILDLSKDLPEELKQ